jgi:hypothetical protein
MQTLRTTIVVATATAALAVLSTAPLANGSSDDGDPWENGRQAAPNLPLDGGETDAGNLDALPIEVAILTVGIFLPVL